jgi:hypothetical protein
MFLKRTQRIKDGKAHHYWSVVENRRLLNGKVAQRQVLYLGEINDSQQLAWRKTIEVFDEGAKRQVALFPEGEQPAGDAKAVGVRQHRPDLFWHGASSSSGPAPRPFSHPRRRHDDCSEERRRQPRV